MSDVLSPEEALSSALANPPPLPEPEPAGQLVAYAFGSSPPLPLRPAARRRQWMDETNGRFAYRCLPLLTGNQQGWELLAPVGFTAMWDGSNSRGAIRVAYDAPGFGDFAVSHFGYGLLTIMPGYLFRTPKGVNVVLRGPTNAPKAGATALEGVVEADWNVFNATVNWKLTIPGCVVRFEKGEPIGLVVPIPRGYVETLAPEIRDLPSNPALKGAVDAWNMERTTYERGKQGNEWLARYLRGVDMQGETVADDHKRRIGIRPVVDRRASSEPAAAPSPPPAASVDLAPERIRLTEDESAALTALRDLQAERDRVARGLEDEIRAVRLRRSELDDKLAAFRARSDQAQGAGWDDLQARIQRRLGQALPVPVGFRLVVEAEGADTFLTFAREAR